MLRCDYCELKAGLALLSTPAGSRIYVLMTSSAHRLLTNDKPRLQIHSDATSLLTQPQLPRLHPLRLRRLYIDILAHYNIFDNCSEVMSEGDDSRYYVERKPARSILERESCSLQSVLPIYHISYVVPK
jgi:hypothetical protein